MKRPRYFATSTIVTHLLLASVSAITADVAAAPPAVDTYRVPMRDGVRLATDVYLPSPDAKGLPCILVRTPYGRTQYGEENGSWARWGFAVAIQDTRGRFDSEGKGMAFESDGWGDLRDGHDTVEWLAKQPFCNGRIGTVGASAMGITQLLLAPTRPAALRCQYVLVAAASQYHHAAYQGGALRKSQVERWLQGNGFHPDSLAKTLAHPLYDDYWRGFDAVRTAARVRVPAIHFGGWYDTFCQGTIDAFTSRQLRGGDGARGRQKLVMGPWTHGGQGRSQFGEFRLPRAARRLPDGFGARQWFERHLGDGAKAAKNADEIPAVAYYVMGPLDGSASSGNVWRTAASWPPRATNAAWYLGAEGALSADAKPAARGLSYEYDPADPCPTVGGRNLVIEAGPKDQREIEARDDVLVFTSAPLSDEIEVTGRITARVFLKSDRRDTDVVVRLCDVYPDGRSVLIADGIRRAGISDDFTRVEPLIPGKAREVEVDLWSTSVVFAVGHRIRVSVTSSNFPRSEANPNRPIGTPGRSAAPLVARNTILLGGSTPSRILLPIVRD